MRFQAALIDDEHRGGTIAYLTRICRAQHAAFLKQLHGADSLHAGVETHALIDRMHAVGNSQWHDLFFERARMNRRGCALMTAKRVLIELFSAEPVFLRHHLRADELTELLDAVTLADPL